MTPSPVTIEDLNKLMEFNTLHGTIHDWLLQISHGTQQIKVYSDINFSNNSINTALRIRSRKILQYLMTLYNPQTTSNFKEIIRYFYYSTIYVLPLGTIKLKAKYFRITYTDPYLIKYQDSSFDSSFDNSFSERIIYDGILSPSSIIFYTENEELVSNLQCFQNNRLKSNINIKTVNELFDIAYYYNTLFGLPQKESFDQSFDESFS